MPQRQLTAAQQHQKTQREVEDLHLVIRARNGDDSALDSLMRRYTGFVRLKASSYFLAGGDSEDLIQEGLIGLYKAVHDPLRQGDVVPELRRAVHHPPDHHRDQDGDPVQASPLNTYVSFSQTPAGQDNSDVTLGDAIAGPSVDDPAICVISTEELQSLVFTLGTASRRSSRRAPPLPRGTLLRGHGRGARAATRRLAFDHRPPERDATEHSAGRCHDAGRTGARTRWRRTRWSRRRSRQAQLAAGAS